MAEYSSLNCPSSEHPNYLSESSYSDNPNYPKLIRVRAHTRWRLGRLEHVAAHWRYVYKH